MLAAWKSGLGLLSLVFAAGADPVWTATLRSPEGGVVGATARIEPFGTDSLRITIDVRGAAPDATIPWFLYRGRCGQLGAIHGQRDAYPPLVTDLTGETWEIVSLAAPLAAGEPYAVAIGGEGGSPLACGNLAVVVADRSP
jgi:hypothetical protein